MGKGRDPWQPRAERGRGRDPWQGQRPRKAGQGSLASKVRDDDNVLPGRTGAHRVADERWVDGQAVGEVVGRCALRGEVVIQHRVHPPSEGPA